MPLVLRQLGLETPVDAIDVLMKHFAVSGKPSVVDAASMLAALRGSA